MTDKEEVRLEREVERKLSGAFNTAQQPEASPQISADYENFKKAFMPAHLSLYERLCKNAENILHLQPDKKQVPDMEEAIRITHLNITPSGAASFAVLYPLLFVLLSALLFGLLPFALNGAPQTFLLVLAVIVGLILIIPLGKLPHYLANNWRIKASNQMVICVFYVVSYMRHTSNLELAVQFAADHLTKPLSLDLKKVLWDVETSKFGSVKESLDFYLDSWKKWNGEFIESMHLIESSLYESSDDRRLNALDKALRVMLDETYEKMLHFAHDLRGPITMLHMLGIILPILGLVILPLMVSFVPEVKWYHLFAFYNVLLPLGVYYLGRLILSKRPTGYGETDISEENPELRKYRNAIIKVGNSEIQVNPIMPAVGVFVVLFLIGISPLIIHATNPEFDLVVTNTYSVQPRYAVDEASIRFALLDYREKTDANNNPYELGPFGEGATLLSLFIVLAFGLSFGMYYRMRSVRVYEIRKKSKALEKEFASALFQLGNRLGDGIPVEIAFSKVSKVMEGTISGRFFDIVSSNIQRMGMGVKEAIFNKKQGALLYYPSSMIESSMKVLIQGVKKGPLVASQALINISEYIKDIRRVDERLKDLMAEVISSMQSQISFLTPTIAGIVVGITAMITKIMGSLDTRLGGLTENTTGANVALNILQDLSGGVPTFFFAMIVGLYVVQIVFILSTLVNGVQNGVDKLNERYLLGQNLVKSTLTFVIISFVILIVFSLIAGNIVTGIDLA